MIGQISPGKKGHPNNDRFLERFKQAAIAGTSFGFMAVLISAPAVSGLTAGTQKLQAGINLPASVQGVGEFQVNTFTTNRQIHGSIAMDEDGDFVVVWQSLESAGSDNSDYSIQGQRYTKEGVPVGGQFQVNTYTTGAQSKPVVAMDADGDFVVIWQSVGSEGDDKNDLSIQGQRYTKTGAMNGSQFQVNTFTTGNQDYPEVAMDANGNFVVVWSSNPSSDADIRARRYNNSGVAQGSDFNVNTYTTNDQSRPAVAMDLDGDFVVVWQSRGTPTGNTDTSDFSIQGQRYTKTGAANGTQFQVNTYTTSTQIYPSVGIDDDGDFVVVWQSFGSFGTDSSGHSVQGQRFNAAGVKQSSQFQVNQYTTSLQSDPAVAMDGSGDFIITWVSVGSRGSDTQPFSIQGAHYLSAGISQLGEFQVNTFTTSTQNRSAVAMDRFGDYIVVWDSDGSFGNDNDSESIQARLFPKPPIINLLPSVWKP